MDIEEKKLGHCGSVRQLRTEHIRRVRKPATVIAHSRDETPTGTALAQTVNKFLVCSDGISARKRDGKMLYPTGLGRDTRDERTDCRETLLDASYARCTEHVNNTSGVIHHHASPLLGFGRPIVGAPIEY
jgi:hypothetical protein